MTKKQKIMCNTVIHTASAVAASIGAGLAQVPCSDSAIITPIQLAMTVSLGKVFGVRLSKASAKSAMATGMTTLIGRATSQLLVGWIPVAGNIINASTAATITEALGWILAKEFEEDCLKLSVTEESYMLPDDQKSFEIKLIDYIGGEDNDDKAENDSIEAVKKIAKQLKLFQKNRIVG